MRNLLFILFVITSTPVLASWAKLVKTDNTTFYIDQATIHKNGQFVKVAELLDFNPKASEAMALSLKLQTEYDCKAEKYRILEATPFSGNLLSGNMLTLSKEETGDVLQMKQWLLIDPDAPLHIILNAVCHDWERVVNTDNGTFYIDKTSIKKNDQFVSVWELVDLKERDEKFGFYSMRWLKEYDCKGEKFREHQFFVHSEPMAQGNVVSGEQSTSEWEQLNEQKKVILPMLCG